MSIAPSQTMSMQSLPDPQLAFPGFGASSHAGGTDHVVTQHPSALQCPGDIADVTERSPAWQLGLEEGKQPLAMLLAASCHLKDGTTASPTSVFQGRRAERALGVTPRSLAGALLTHVPSS